MQRASIILASQWRRRLYFCNFFMVIALVFSDSHYVVGGLFIWFVFCAAQMFFYAVRAHQCDTLIALGGIMR